MNKQISNWMTAVLGLALCLALLTVVVSSYIRLVESGVGCDDWPGCYGQYQNNESSHGVNVLTAQGKDSPYRAARISHRLLTSALGILILVVFVSAWRSKHRLLTGRLLPSALLLLAICLALIGQFHPSRPLPIMTMANFTGGLLLVALIYRLYARLRLESSQAMSKDFEVGSGKLIVAIRSGMALMTFQILWGAWTSANFAGASCKGLFDCQSLPTESTMSLVHFDQLPLDASGKVVANDAMSAIQQIHHGLSVVLIVYFVMLTAWLMRVAPGLKPNCLVVLALLMVQYLLGMSALLFQLPLAIMVAHNLLAALLMIALISLYLQIIPGPVLKTKARPDI